jgi:glycine dehydrogenase
MRSPLLHPDRFVDRHVGPDENEIRQMLRVLEVGSLDELMDQTIPRSIRTRSPLAIPPGRNEHALLEELRQLASRNEVWRSWIGMGFSDCITPPVILRNVFQNPGWYTQYTPYQAEISQGRLEALLNFQTMVIDLTGLEVANASLLDEASAAAEAMHMFSAVRAREDARTFFVSELCHPQNIDVVRTRAEPLGIRVVVGNHETFDFQGGVFGALVQYPTTDGAALDYRAFCDKAHANGALVVAAADLLSLALLTPPGEFGADAAVGNTQRFGVPLGYGGPHAAFLAARSAHVRHMPGRIIGVSEDARGKPALRMALQTREQHIRREKATSNICTAQVLLAVMAGMYAVYHGSRGIKAIAERVHLMASVLARGLARLGFKARHENFFDTLRIDTTPDQARAIHAEAARRRINLRRIDEKSIGIALDETTRPSDLDDLLAVFARGASVEVDVEELARDGGAPFPPALRRTSGYLTHPVFNTHHSETEMLRYIKQLESRDLSLAQSMIPLGSCTMKLNATAEMIPVTWDELSRLHPFAPVEQTRGYQELFRQLEAALADITGFAATSLQPNAGSQGEYAGLLGIRKYHQQGGQGHRDVCLIPSSAHGTNPASAVMAGYRVVVVRCDDQGNIQLPDLEAKIAEHGDRVAALMVTYPSTHGVFEEEIKEICAAVHAAGGQVYMDGANLNALVGLTRPAEIGADVCHINLHKTFCIPHGGGGPGMGPICVAAHLAPFLPGHPVLKTGGPEAIGAISAAPWGSASILPISWMYIELMGGEGLKRATEVAILNANYIAKRLHPHYPVLYRGRNGRVAHECIVDLRPLKKTSGVEVEDVAKRLIDYGFHAPTVSFPVPGTLMIEPTESEAKSELDRFCQAMISIREEIRAIEDGRVGRDDNPLKNAPHTADMVTADDWSHPYSRSQAAFPTEAVRSRKFWPFVARVNQVLGDRRLICACPPISEYEERARRTA